MTLFPPPLSLSLHPTFPPLLTAQLCFRFYFDVSSCNKFMYILDCVEF